MVWVSDRGILTNSKINELVKPIEGLDYITGLTKPQIRKLAEVEVIQLGFDLKVRPIYHYKGDRVKAHIFLCMLAYYVEWHLKQSLAPLLFEDEEIDDGSLNVIKASRSESVQSKERKKRNQENFPVHSFRTLLEDLGTICLNTVECTIREGSYRFSKITRPTQLQQKALDLLGVSLICTQ